mgnify:CR=1 FL=1
MTDNIAFVIALFVVWPVFWWAAVRLIRKKQIRAFFGHLIGLGVGFWIAVIAAGILRAMSGFFVLVFLIAVAAFVRYIEKSTARENIVDVLRPNNKPEAALTLKYDKPPHQIEADELLKEATARKTKKDWDGAIECLRNAYAVLGEDIVNYPIQTALRLPLFLQQAGRLDEAMQEFEGLLNEVDLRIAKGFNHQTKLVRTMLAHAEYATIYDKMRLACRRQKLPEQVAKYAALAENHWREHAKLMDRDL